MVPATMKFLWAIKPIKNQDTADTEEILELYCIKTSRGGKAPLEGDAITDARQDIDQRSSPSISMNINATGAKKWKG